MYIPEALFRLKKLSRDSLTEKLENFKVQSIVVASRQRIEELFKLM